MAELRIGCLVMAAGSGSRFGRNKLEAVVDGKSLLRRSLEAVPAEEFAQVTVVTQYDAAAALAEARGLRVVQDRCPKIEYQRLYGELRMGGFATGVISSRLPG